jgi:hypothetical protein
MMRANCTCRLQLKICVNNTCFLQAFGESSEGLHYVKIICSTSSLRCGLICQNMSVSAEAMPSCSEHKHHAHRSARQPREPCCEPRRAKDLKTPDGVGRSRLAAGEGVHMKAVMLFRDVSYELSFEACRKYCFITPVLILRIFVSQLD